MVPSALWPAHPVWVEHIVNMEKDIGSELTMSCVATGKPKPHIHWLKNGEPVRSHIPVRLPWKQTQTSAF